MRKKHAILLGVLFILSALLLGLKRREADDLQSQTRFLMDTYCTIKAPGGTHVLRVIERAMDRIDEVDQKFNCLNPGSPIYEFNTHDTPISDPEVVGLVRTALDISEKTGGEYDITVFPVMDEWGFFTGNPRVPSRSRIDDLLKSVGYRNLQIEQGILTKSNKDTRIDLGSIAKGYAVGEALKVLRQSGIASALIDAGGDIYALGTYRGRLWKVGIR
ncbi:MAG: FAD:protein FMN transferase, partial [Candidatus Latescibacterota bacterium]